MKGLQIRGRKKTKSCQHGKEKRREPNVFEKRKEGGGVHLLGTVQDSGGTYPSIKFEKEKNRTPNISQERKGSVDVIIKEKKKGSLHI